MKKYLGIIGLLIVTIIWGGGFVACDMALESLTTMQILAVRFFIATLVMALLGRKDLTHMSKNEVRKGCLLGAVLFLGFVSQTVGLIYTTPSKNAFLTTINVVLVPFIAFVVTGKKVGKDALLGAVLAVIGTGVLSLTSRFTISLGDGLTLLCAVFFAMQIFLTGLFVQEIRPAVLNFLQMGTAFLLSLIGMTVKGEWHFAPTQESLLAVLYLGVMSTAVTYLLQTASQKYVEETQAAIILSMEAVFGTVFSVIILHEQITGRMLLGAALILTAVIISEVPGLIKPEKKHNKQ